MITYIMNATIRQQPISLLRSLPFFFCLFLLISSSTLLVQADDACCKAAAAAASGGALQIPHPFEKQPIEWNVEDDGVWEPPLVALQDLPTWYRFWYEYYTIGIQASAPWLLLGILVAATMGTIFSRISNSSNKTLANWFGSSSNSSSRKQQSILYSSIIGAVIGLLVPLCSCGALPLAVSLASQGIDVPAIAAFVTAAQASGIDSAIYTLGQFGSVICLLRLICAVILAVVVGTVLGTCSNSASSSCSNGVDGNTAANGGCCNGVAGDDATTTNSSNGATTTTASTCCGGSGDDNPSGKTQNLVIVWIRQVLDLYAQVAPWVLGASVMASAVANLYGSASTAIATNSTINNGDAGSTTTTIVLLRLLLLTALLPIQICEHGIVAVVAALRNTAAASTGSGGVSSLLLSPGMCLSLLVVGPATNVGTLVLLSKLCRRREENDGQSQQSKYQVAVTIAQLAGSIIATGILLSFLVDSCIPHDLLQPLVGRGEPNESKTASSPPMMQFSLPESYTQLAVPVVIVLTVISVLRYIMSLLSSVYHSSRMNTGHPPRGGTKKEKVQ